MDHNEIRHKLSEYIDDAVSAEERAAIDQHLATCIDCADAVRELRTTIEHLRTVEEIQPPAWLAGKVMAAVRTEQEKNRSIVHRFFFILRTWLPVQAIAVLFLTITLYYLYSSTSHREPYSEVPAEKTSPETARQTAPKTPEGAVPELSAPRQQKVVRPEYKALDMKYAYEPPAPPTPAEAPAPAAPEKAPVPMTPESKEAAAENGGASPDRIHDGKSRQVASPGSAPAAAMPGSKGTTLQEESSPLTADRPETEEDIREIVLEHFYAHDLPADGRTKGATVSIERMELDPERLKDLAADMLRNIERCAERFVLHFRQGTAGQRYFYCYEQGAVRLLGTDAGRGTQPENRSTPPGPGQDR